MNILYCIVDGRATVIIEDEAEKEIIKTAKKAYTDGISKFYNSQSAIEREVSRYLVETYITEYSSKLFAISNYEAFLRALEEAVKEQ